VDRKNICLVIHSLQAGGMERVMSELADYFCRKNGVIVHMVLYGRKPVIFYHIPDNLIIHKPILDFNDRFRRLSTLKRMLFLRKTIKSINPVTVLSFGENWNSFVILSLLGLRYPVFVSDRCRPDKNLGPFYQNLRKLLYPKAAGIIVQTSLAKEIYQKSIKHSSFKVIGNPVREISTDQVVKKENIVLTVGRIIPTKNHSRLIDSFLNLNNSEWNLVIVGGNALNMNLIKNLEDQINEKGANGKIILTGSRADVDLFYRKSRIFVLTSESEGFPNVIGEAMSAGLPVVAFDCIAGPSEIITDGKDGFLIPLHNYKILEDRLYSLMNDPEMRDRIGNEARKSITRFSPQNICEDFFSYITSPN
jgi:GalNAc-alpha-(1->4)-GalNAc-alpha-(1->3)-diNAcBac-PP-undecaprenol alpha-1,4-N-acetyl-D-galactosaminyltransferase